MVITGGSAGIGVETARVFHATGAKLFLTVRDFAKGQKVVDSILADDESKKAEINHDQEGTQFAGFGSRRSKGDSQQDR